MKWIEELSRRRRFGVKPGLENITSLMERLGRPHEGIPSIHIAGTNGKGAVSAILDALLQGVYKKVGRYTSPHLVKINERFFINAKPCGSEELSAHARDVFLAAAGGNVTFFEALTAVAFLMFKRSKVDCAILECGLGGRFDATNIVNPMASVITRIGLDHCSFLGSTLEEITREKAGIIKKSVPVVLGRNDKKVVDIVRACALEAGSPFFYAPEIVDERVLGGEFPLGGSFNRENAVTALAALSVLGIKYDVGRLARVVWPGRFQKVGDVIVDGAHNPAGAKALADSLGGGAFALVAGFCADKDVGEVLREFSRFAEKGFAVAIKNERSLPARETAEMMNRAGIESTSCVSVSEAIESARRTGLPVVVSGSLFLVGEALLILDAYPWPELLVETGVNEIDESEKMA